MKAVNMGKSTASKNSNNHGLAIRVGDGGDQPSHFGHLAVAAPERMNPDGLAMISIY